VAAFFLIAMCGSPLAQACENCERLDVTAAVNTATSLVLDTMRGWRARDDADSLDAELTVAEYAAAYDASDGQRSIEMPNFRHDHAWQLTYRSEAAEALAQRAQQRFPGVNIELDDSWVVGLRFEWDYGWTR
jgi:hypothetical protein